MSEPWESPPGGSCAWEAVFTTHYVGLCEHVLRLVGSAEVAEDLVQDLFLELCASRGSRNGACVSGAYLHVAARNRALKYLRHRRVAAAWVERAERDATPLADTPEELCLRRELDDAVRRAVARLPDRCREIFLLRRRDQLGYEAIAERLGVSLGTVKSQMWRATLRLKHELAPYLARAAPAIIEPTPTVGAV